MIQRNGPLRGLTYAALASRYEVEYCPGRWACGTLESGHDDGAIDMLTGTLHWRERKVTRSGLRAFLLLVSWFHLAPMETVVRNPMRRALVKAQRIHSENSWAYHTALHDLGIRLSRDLSKIDRARVRYLIRDHVSSEVVKSLREWARE